MKGVWLPAIFVLMMVWAGCIGDDAAETDAASPEDAEENTPSLGVVDFPKQGATVGQTAFVAGWALDKQGIDAVHIYVNEQHEASVGLTVSRPDVGAVYSGFGRGRYLHGWGVDVPFGVEVRPALVRVEAVDKTGAVTVLDEFMVHVEP